MFRNKLLLCTAAATMTACPVAAASAAEPSQTAAVTAQSGGAIADTADSEGDQVQTAKEIVVQGSIACAE